MSGIREECGIFGIRTAEKKPLAHLAAAGLTALQHRGQEAAGIAVETVTQWLTAHPDAMDRVIFNVFTERDRSYYEQNLR